jgi:hypothetical protein
MRQVMYGYEPTTARLQRVLTVVVRSPGWLLADWRLCGWLSWVSPSGLEFADAYTQRVVDTIDGVPVNIISLARLKANKRANGRLKDLGDIENLP